MLKVFVPHEIIVIPTHTTSVHALRITCTQTYIARAYTCI